MRIKIISNGKPRGSHIVNAETGEEIEGIVSCDVHIDYKGARATLELIWPELDAESIALEDKTHD